MVWIDEHFRVESMDLKLINVTTCIPRHVYIVSWMIVFVNSL